MIWISLALTYLGLISFALAMQVHHRALFGRVPTTRMKTTCRIAGSAALLAAVVTTMWAQGWQIGLVTWVGSLGLGGFVLTLLLALRPRLIVLPVLVTLLVPLIGVAG